MKKLEQVKKTYSIIQYENGIQEMYTQIKVKSTSGKVFEIYKKTNNVEEAVFYITDDVFRMSKKSVINYLKKN